MLSGFFNYDNPVWRFIGKFFDLMILNLLWVVCSIPIFTIGASTTAVYYVTLKLVRDEEGATVKSFFKSFRENFKQATIIWLLLLAVGAIIGTDLYFFLVLQTGESLLRKLMVSVFIAFAVFYAGAVLYAFPLQCRFYNPVKRTLFNAMFMSMRHFLQTILMLAADVAIPLVMMFAVPMLQPLLLLFGFPLIAFLNSFFFVAIFDKYMPKKEEHEELGELAALDEE